MSQHIYPGGPVMVKIDGTKIRTIRETKGLTQLYIATVVEVTTDTVSRWENRRYPTIKKENALKLAEALEVDFNDILDIDETPDASAPADSDDFERLATGADSASTDQKIAKSWKSYRAPALLILALLGAAAVYFTFAHQEPVAANISVRRIVSSHFIAGQPLPVFLHIDGPKDKQIAIILKETLPPGSHLEKAVPEISGNDKKDNSIKWLQKITGPVTFFYTITSDPSFQGQFSFAGSLKMASTEATAINISGDNKSIAGMHHWADVNSDNRISDEEILGVYDLVLPNKNMGINMDLIEEMWLGDGYIWHPQEKRFSINE